MIWKASSDVVNLLNEIKAKHHKRLEEASVALSFTDAKPFVGDRFNWGKTSKFSQTVKVWQDKVYDFLITLPMEGWTEILTSEQQRSAWLDLHLTRCRAAYLPQVVMENGKKVVVKDEWGRVQYTDEIKRDADGHPRWMLWDLDLCVFQENVQRFGCWCPDLIDFKSAVSKEEE